MTADEKYIVFKKDEYEEWENEVCLAMQVPPPITSVGDAVVIRLQDRFAAHALRGYASALLTASEVLDEVGAPESSKALLSIADHFMQKADEADALRWDGEAKYPD